MLCPKCDQSSDHTQTSRTAAERAAVEKYFPVGCALLVVFLFSLEAISVGVSPLVAAFGLVVMAVVVLGLGLLAAGMKIGK